MATSNGSHDVKGPSVSAQDKPINVLLIGLGSIGSVYAHILERTGRVNVTAVARSNYEIYSSGKVTLDTDKFGKHDGWKPHRVVKSQAEALEGDIIYDYCLITTKCLPDINPTPKLVQEVIASKKVRAWSLIQNGLGVEEDLYQAVKHLDTPIVSSCAWIGVMTSPDGRQVTWRGFDKLVSGIYPPLAPIDQPQEREYSQKEKEALDVWHGLLKDGGAEISLEDRIDSIRFSKNVWNCSWSSVQAFIRGTPDTFVDFPEDQRAPLKAFMREVVDTGFKSGLLRKGQYQYPFGGEIGTPESVAEHAWGRIFEMSVEKVKQGVPPHKMSLLIDIEQNRPFEVEVITGAVLRLAQKHGLETPNLALIYTLMKGLQYNIVKTREQGTKS